MKRFDRSIQNGQCQIVIGIPSPYLSNWTLLDPFCVMKMIIWTRSYEIYILCPCKVCYFMLLGRQSLTWGTIGELLDPEQHKNDISRKPFNGDKVTQVTISICKHNDINRGDAKRLKNADVFKKMCQLIQLLRSQKISLKNVSEIAILPFHFFVFKLLRFQADIANMVSWAKDLWHQLIVGYRKPKYIRKTEWKKMEIRVLSYGSFP